MMAVVWSPDGQYLASGNMDGTIQIRDPESGGAVQTLTGHTGQVNSLAWSVDGHILASGSCDNTVKLWDVAARRSTQTLKGHTDWIVSAIWLAHHSTLYLLSASNDKTIRLWDPSTGNQKRIIEGHTGSGSVVASEVDLISQRLMGTEAEKETVMPVLLVGEKKTSLPPLMWDRVYRDFRNERAYFTTAFDLILDLYRIAHGSLAVADLRGSLLNFDMR